MKMTSERDVQRCNTWPVRISINFNSEVASARRLAEENECERRIAEAGDDGGRSLSRRRRQEIYLNGDINTLETGLKNITTDGASSISPPSYSPQGYPSPLRSDIVSHPPLSDHPLLIPSSLAGENGRDQLADMPQPPKDNEEDLPCIMEWVSSLTYLAAFGIIGVLIRYGLQVLFGPDVANVTNVRSPLYIDLPSNMVGSFFMGWVGVVFKRDIANFSEFLSIGLTTGLMGSITTFTAWMQEITNLTTQGYWVRGLIGILLGMELAYMSLLIGIGTAELLKRNSASIHNQLIKKWPNLICIPSTNNYQRHIYGLIIFLAICGILWIGGLVLSVINFVSRHGTKLWFACIVGPFGVWTRWHLARLNGQGIGAKKYLKWLPVGTLATNLIATCLMATLSLSNLMVKDKNSKLVLAGLELGFLGCMSTVSTFVAEAHAMYQSSHPWRAFAYVFLTLVVAFILETLIYSIPVWVNGYSQT